MKPRIPHSTASKTPSSTQVTNDEVVYRMVRIDLAINKATGIAEYALIEGKMFVPKGSAEQNERPKYAPNRKYQDEDFRRFEYWYEVKQSQELAYDEMVREDPQRFKADKFKSFIAGYRVWLRGKVKLACRQNKLGYS